jgi:outer membrane protein OmpA-like peptidoglycan-associated protein
MSKEKEQKKANNRRLKRRSTTNSAPQSSTANELMPIGLAHREILGGVGMQELRQTAVLQEQRLHGNTFVQRQLANGIADLQRDCPPDCPREPRRRVPGLSDATVILIEDKIDSGNHQDAINLVVNELASQGRIDTSQLDGGTMSYGASMTDEGHTTTYWDKDPVLHPDARLLPFEVSVGPSAFSSVPWLYATVIHEWRHVQQFRVPQSMADKDAANESDAYLNGIEQAWASGLTTEEVTELWDRLNRDHWPRITDAGVKAALQVRYDAAQAYVNSLLTSDLAPRVFQRLTFSQLFFATGSAQLDSTANDELEQLVRQAQDFRNEHPDYDLRFTLTGFASPRWRHPDRGAMPADLNQALSQERAENSLAQLQNAFHAEGDGACDFRIQSCLSEEVTVDDPTWDSLTKGEGSEPALAEGRDLNSDDQQDRRVDIIVEYSPGARVPTRPPDFLGGGGGGV